MFLEVSIAKIIAKCRFTQAKNAPKSFGLKIDYISRNQAIGKTNNILYEGYLSRYDVLQARKNFFEDEENNPTMYYSKFGAVKQNDLITRNAVKKSFDSNYEKQHGCLYENVISFDKEFTSKFIHGNTQSELAKKIDLQLRQFLLENNFELENIEYAISFHTNTKNFHVHIDFVEKTITREKNALQQKTINRLKKRIVDSLDPQAKMQNLENLKRITILKNSVKNEVSDFDDFSKKINWTGPSKYNSIENKKSKYIINACFDKFKSNEIYLNYLSHLKYQEEIYIQKYGATKNDGYYKNKKDEVDLMVKNQIIKKLKSGEKYENNQSKNNRARAFHERSI